MKKKKRGIKIEINLDRRGFYTLIVVGILLMVSIGVYAYNSGGPASVVGHSFEEIELPVCSDQQVLYWTGSQWECGNIKLLSYNGWFTTYNYCWDVCEDQGYSCASAEYTDTGEIASCSSGSAREKRCFCLKTEIE